MHRAPIVVIRRTNNSEYLSASGGVDTEIAKKSAIYVGELVSLFSTTVFIKSTGAFCPVHNSN